MDERALEEALARIRITFRLLWCLLAGFGGLLLFEILVIWSAIRAGDVAYGSGGYLIGLVCSVPLLGAIVLFFLYQDIKRKLASLAR